MSDLQILGHRVEGAISADQIECIPSPEHVQRIEFKSKEVTAFCPVTHQPDLYTVTIKYEPKALALESKALKLYLNSFRDRGIFAEGLADEIATAVYKACDPEWVEVVVKQQVRGGLVLTATAVR